MSTHYLVSHFDNQINGVVAATGVNPQTTITGNYVVRIPDDVSVKNPTGLADLLTKKYAGILGTYGSFTQVLYDDMLDATGVDTVTLGATTGATLGEKGTIGLYHTNLAATPAHTPQLTTTPQAIIWGGAPPGPAQALLTYELFTYADTDDKDEAYVRAYKELTPDLDVSVEISFNGGFSFVSTTDKALISVPIPARGSVVVLRFTRLTAHGVGVPNRVLIGSWALLF
jgi:hypothetical protein